MASQPSKRRLRFPFLGSRSKGSATPGSSQGPAALSCDDSATTHPALHNEPRPNAQQRKLGLLRLTPELPADQLDERSPDIIAIHGICGDPLKTWTHENGALWLRDFLPKDINGARVFSFGYDAEVAFTKTQATLDHFARSLLNNIKLERDGKQESRPLIFICHSMGGIVLKKALAIARLEDKDEFPFLPTSVRGIFFLGTPHCGSDAIKWPKLLSNIATVGLSAASGLIGSFRNDLLQNLERSSETLKEISIDVRNQLKDVQIISCIEQRTTTPHSKLIVDQETGTLGFPGEIIITMDGCDHCTICRFSNEKDQNYRVLTSRIKNLLVTSKQVIHDPTDCLKYLYFKEMDDRQHDIQLAAETTCEWLMRYRRFESWNENGGLLWIKGNPGTGKSTIMKYVLQQMSRDKSAVQKNRVLFSFFFHARGSPLQYTPLGFYRSILHQILDQVPSALSDLIIDFKKNVQVKGTPGENWDWHENQLRAFLESSVPKILEYYSVQIFVDALDESGADAACALVKEFQDLISRYSKASSSPFGICFSCRPYPIIDFRGGQEICIDQENFKDVNTYIRSRLPKEKDQIRETIILRASNSFQWARLIVDRVEELRRKGKREKLIRDEILRVPLELNELYRDLLERIDEEEKPEVLNLFQWILFALRPLSLNELRFATAMNPDIQYASLRQYRDEGILTEDNNEMEKRLKSLSRGLAEIQMHNDTPIVQLIHQSVNDFLFNGGLQILLGEKWQSLDVAIGSADSILSRSCIRYIDMEEIVLRKDIYWKETVQFELPFLRYATLSWLTHLEQAYAKGIPQVDLIDFFHWPSNDLLEQWVEIYEKLKRYSDVNVPRYTTLLHVASRYGIVDILSAVLATLNEASVAVDLKDDWGRTPLSWAAVNGQEVVVKLLLDSNKVEVNSKDKEGRTPLSWAAENGHEVVVKLLLDSNKVEVDSKDDWRPTPLSWAARNGHEVVVKLLLDSNKVEVDSKDVWGRTPLSLAAGNGHEVVVKLLLDSNKVEVDSKDDSGRTPLSWAAKNGRDTVVKLLLDSNKVEVNSKDDEGNTPLYWAKHYGYEEVVKLLLDHGADISICREEEVEEEEEEKEEEEEEEQEEEEEE